MNGSRQVLGWGVEERLRSPWRFVASAPVEPPQPLSSCRLRSPCVFRLGRTGEMGRRSHNLFSLLRAWKGCGEKYWRETLARLPFLYRVKVSLY